MIFFVCVITHHNVFNVGLKTTPLLPVWPRDAKRLDTSDVKSDELGVGFHQNHQVSAVMSSA